MQQFAKRYTATNFLAVHDVSVCQALPAFGTSLCLTTVRNPRAASQYEKLASQEIIPQFTVNSFAHAAQVHENFCRNESETIFSTGALATLVDSLGNFVKSWRLHTGSLSQRYDVMSCKELSNKEVELGKLPACVVQTPSNKQTTSH